MSYLKYLIFGIYFGFVLVRSEVTSWFRIQEMFRFQSFHMYGVIGSAVLVGMITVWLIRKFNLKTISGEPIVIPKKQWSRYRYILGGIVFGLGWGMTGACPGPQFALVGMGFTVFIVVIFAAYLGTLAYSYLRPKLPH